MSDHDQLVGEIVDGLRNSGARLEFTGRPTREEAALVRDSLGPLFVLDVRLLQNTIPGIGIWVVRFSITKGGSTRRDPATDKAMETAGEQVELKLKPDQVQSAEQRADAIARVIRMAKAARADG